MRFMLRGAVAAATIFLVPAAALAGSAPVYQWDGLYGGVQAGYSLAGSAEDNIPPTNPNPWRTGSEGGSAGLFAGYNQAFGNWVGGVEMDVNGGGLAGHYLDAYYNGPLYAQDWSTAERVRLGFLAGPSTLFYGSVGLAQGNMDLSKGYWPYEGYAAPNQIVSGLQLGAGVEAFVTPHLSARLEGTFTQYGSAYVYYYGERRATERLDSLAAQIGIAYHPGLLGGSAIAAATAPAGRSWAGMYVGGQAGARMLETVEDYNPDYYTPYGPAYSFASKVAGSVGGYAGYNWQAGDIVGGIEAGAELPNLAVRWGTTPYVDNAWTAGIRARVGIVTPGDTLLYASLGWAVGQFDFSGAFPVSSSYAGAAFTASGLQVGLGAEAFLTPRLSMRLESSYAQYGKHDISYRDAPYWTVRPTTLEARVGLSYHLN